MPASKTGWQAGRTGEWGKGAAGSAALAKLYGVRNAKDIGPKLSMYLGVSKMSAR